MFKNIYWILILFVLSCQTTNHKTELHYSEEKLVLVLKDLYFAQAALKDVKPELIDSLQILYRTQISIIHDVDLELLEEDITAAQLDVERYKKIHSLVQDSIVLLDKKMSEKKE